MLHAQAVDVVAEAVGTGIFAQERVEAVLAQGRYLHQVFAVEVGV